MTIRLLLAYNTFPVWLYDDGGLVIDTCLPDEWCDDEALETLWSDVADFYDTLFTDNGSQFSFDGFHNQAEKQQFSALVNRAKEALASKNQEVYQIQDDIDTGVIPIR